MKKGITYTTTGERSRSRMHEYHGSPRALDHSYGATEMDVKNIKTKVTNVGLRVANYRSNYTIGFEIEKSSFGRGSQKEYALFKGFERDGSLWRRSYYKHTTITSCITMEEQNL